VIYTRKEEEKVAKRKEGRKEGRKRTKEKEVRRRKSRDWIHRHLHHFAWLK
jgi:hypothetical protein